jgi:hypothetical protein
MNSIRQMLGKLGPLNYKSEAVIGYFKVVCNLCL